MRPNGLRLDPVQILSGIWGSGRTGLGCGMLPCLLRSASVTINLRTRRWRFSLCLSFFFFNLGFVSSYGNHEYV